MARFRIDRIILILSRENIAEVFNIESLREIKTDGRTHSLLQKINYFLEWLIILKSSLIFHHSIL